MLYQTIIIAALVTTMVFIGIMKFLQLKALMLLQCQHGKYDDLAVSIGELVLSAIFWPIVAALQYIARLVPMQPALDPKVVAQTVAAPIVADKTEPTISLSSVMRGGNSPIVNN